VDDDNEEMWISRMMSTSSASGSSTDQKARLTCGGHKEQGRGTRVRLYCTESTLYWGRVTRGTIRLQKEGRREKEAHDGARGRPVQPRVQRRLVLRDQAALSHPVAEAGEEGRAYIC